MNPISDLLKNKFVEQSPPKPSDRVRRKLALEDLKKLLDWQDKAGSELWRAFSFPRYIPTEWIDDYKELLIPISMYKRREKLFELLAKSRNK